MRKNTYTQTIIYEWYMRLGLLNASDTSLTHEKMNGEPLMVSCLVFQYLDRHIITFIKDENLAKT